MSAIRGTSCPSCPLCATPGEVLHHDVPDRLFGAPGTWDVRRCPTCRSAWPDPRPLAEDLHLAYRRYYTHDQDDLDGEDSTGIVERAEDAYLRRRYAPDHRLPVVDRLLAVLAGRWPGRRADAEMRALYLRPQPGARLLDVGCGSGLAVAALRRMGWDASGVEPDPAAVARARRRGVPVQQGQLDEVAYPPGSFDAVTMSHVIEHLPTPAPVLHEIHRILRPGGALVVVTPNADSWLHARYGSDWLNLDVPRHLLLFSLSSLRSLLDATGFHVEEAQTTIRAANLVAQAADGFRRRGDYDMTARARPLERMRGEVIQQLAAARLLRKPLEGEELVVIARRR